MILKLTQGKVAIIDDIDSNDLKWYFGTNGYAQRKPRNTKALLLHRYVMSRKLGRELTSKEYVDHISGVKLDCTRGNLRLCTMSQNLANAKLRVDNKSGHRGVLLDKRNGHYTAHVYVNCKKSHLGSFKTLEEAIKARRDKELKMYGSFVIGGQRT